MAVMGRYHIDTLISKDHVTVPCCHFSLQLPVRKYKEGTFYGLCRLNICSRAQAR